MARSAAEGGLLWVVVSRSPPVDRGFSLMGIPFSGHYATPAGIHQTWAVARHIFLILVVIRMLVTYTSHAIFQCYNADF